MQRYIESLIRRARIYHGLNMQLPLWLVAEMNDAGIIIDELQESFE